MFKRMFILSFLFACASMAGEIYDFYLINEAGERSGPFSLKDGQEIVISEEKFSIQLADSSAVAEKLRNIMLPNVEYGHATLEQAVRHIRSSSRRLDPEGKGIDIIFRDKPRVEQAEDKESLDSESQVDDFFKPGKTTQRTSVDWKPINLEATNLSIAECLSIICEQTDSSWSIENGRVVIERFTDS